MKGLLLVQHYSQVNLRRSKKTVSSTGVQNCNDTPLVRKKAQKTARKTSAERNNQYYLLGCPCHGGYKLYPLLRGTKTKTEQKPTKIAQIPKKAARRNARSLTEHADPAVTKAAPAFRTSNCVIYSRRTHDPDGHVGCGRALSHSLPLHGRPPLGLLLGMRVRFLQEGSADPGRGEASWHQRRHPPGARCCCRGGGHRGADGYELHEERKGKKQTQPPESVFLKQRSCGWHSPAGAPR